MESHGGTTLCLCTKRLAGDDIAHGIEGAAELKESAFSSEGLTVGFDRTANGKAKATVTPKGLPPAFFLRVRVK